MTTLVTMAQDETKQEEIKHAEKLKQVMA